MLAATTVCCREATETVPLFFVDRLEQAEIIGERVDDANVEGLWGAVTFRGETRRALTVPFPSRVSFEVTVPPNAVLRFAIGASTMEQPTLLVPLQFGVAVDAGDGEERVFTEKLRRSQPNRWLPREVDLSHWAGASVRLTFDADRVADERPVAEQHVLPLWGNPVLFNSAAQPARPNIILVSIDCLRADHLSAYGYDKPTTPRIDAFARDAVLFENVVAASSYTLPTHASMLTGLPPALHGATVRRAISPSAPYVPESLLRAGYRVNAVVSAAFLSQAYGFHRGFHTYRLTSGRAAAVVDRALGLLDEGEGQAQFFFLHLYDVHAPYAAPADFIHRFGDGETDVTDVLRRMSQQGPPPSDAEIERVIALYDAEVAYVDRELGRFFDELKSRGLYDTSVIILTSDHGEAFQEHGAWEHGRATALDEPGLYEEIVHIPLIVKWPGETMGTRVGNVVSQMDVAATILEAAGIESTSSWAMGLRHHVDGESGSRVRNAISEIATLDSDRGAGLQLVFRTQDRKYIASFRAPTTSELYRSRPIREEVYDLRNDPEETNNLADTSGFELDSFRAALRAYLKAARELAPYDGDDVALDEKLLEQLRALGYIDH